MQPLNSFIDMIRLDSNISEETLERMREKMETRSVPKGTILHRDGERFTSGFFVKRGCLRSYSIDTKGKEHIFAFGPEGWVIGDFVSNTLDEPSELIIDALEDSEIEVLPSDLVRMDGMSLGHKGFLRLARRIAVLQKRVIMLMSATAQERYEHFLETYPSIVQRVPQKMVASYLGITPEALSTIRRRMQQQK